ncbi:hypothetical protein D9V30_13565 [Mycetocola reblochoni]|uniref:Uncharacterized protein n=1 Tax=Mycetocola reblochoni TaxID=331618 RepID=A0A3L6ZHR7_9MICO|nr:hypothetical protein D9V30_13565 [Mycetocola reblochoni]
MIATRNTTTITSFEKINASTKLAHFPNQPFVASQLAPDRAIGAITTATKIRALRMRRLNQTIAAAQIAKKLRKMVMIAPAPGAVRLIAVRPATRTPIFPPISSNVVPVAWMIPIESWSTISSSVAVSVMTRNDPSTDFPRPRAARERAVGSRRMRPVMSCRQKKISMTKIAIPNITLYTPM